MRFAEEDLKLAVAERFGVRPEDVSIVYYEAMPVNACVDVTEYHPKCICKKDVSNLLVFVEHMSKSMEDPFVPAMMRAIRNHDEAKKEPKIVKVPLEPANKAESDKYNPFSEMGLDTLGMDAVADIAKTMADSIVKLLHDECAEKNRTEKNQDVEREVQIAKLMAESETATKRKEMNTTVEHMRKVAGDYGYSVKKAYLQEIEKGVYSPVIEIQPTAIGMTSISINITNQICPFEEIFPIFEGTTQKSDDITPNIVYDVNYGSFMVTLNDVVAVSGNMDAYLTTGIANKMANAANACIALNKIDLSNLPKVKK